MRRAALVVALTLLALAANLPQPAQAADGPCVSPRAAVSRFLDNLQPETNRPDLAVQCFDFSAGPVKPRQQIRRARELHAVLDGQGKFVVYADVPGDPDYVDPATGQARVTLFPTLPDVQLERRDDAWRFTAGTVAAVPRLYSETYRLPIEQLTERLPPVFSKDILGLAGWQWLGLLLLLLVSLVGGRILQLGLTGFFRATAARFFAAWSREHERAILRWSGYLGAAGLASVLLPSLGLAVRVNQAAFVVLEFLACISAVAIAHAVVDFLADALSRRAEATESTMDDALVPLLRRATKLVVNVAGVLFVLQNLDVDIGSLLATLGIGGLAVALAAKDTLSNLFGFLTILADRPFQIGDWVEILGVEGTVEEVGIRSTRVRTFADSLVAIPNSSVANAQINNMGRRRRRRFKSHLTVTYDTPAESMKAFVEGIRASVEAHPLTWKDSYEVHFHQMSGSSLDVLVYLFIDSAVWSEELATRQELMLSWMHLAEGLGIEFAFPTQTMHVASLPEGVARPA